MLRSSVIQKAVSSTTGMRYSSFTKVNKSRTLSPTWSSIALAAVAISASNALPRALNINISYQPTRMLSTSNSKELESFVKETFDKNGVDDADNVIQKLKENQVNNLKVMKTLRGEDWRALGIPIGSMRVLQDALEIEVSCHIFLYSLSSLLIWMQDDERCKAEY